MSDERELPLLEGQHDRNEILREDRPKIVFFAAMMTIQNFGFFMMYYGIFGDIPDIHECTTLRYWIGLFALDCFVESFVCVWMAMAGYTNGFFKTWWIIHLLVALPYVLCTGTIGLSLYSEDGTACQAANSGPLYKLDAVYMTHVGLFLVYVWCMLSVTYYSFVKPLKILEGFFRRPAFSETPLGVFDEDKPKIAFYAAMMTIQNFGFHVMYYGIFGDIPDIHECTTLRYWIGLFALDCFVESFVCVWMAMAGYTNNSGLFKTWWIIHLLVALPYCLCTVTIGLSLYSEDGTACQAANSGPLYKLNAVYMTHVGLFLVYVWCMLSITYHSFIRPALIDGNALAQKPQTELGTLGGTTMGA